MNENLNLVEILKDCPKGTKLYSILHGEVEYEGINDNHNAYKIEFKAEDGDICGVTIDGKLVCYYSGECILFPAKDQRDWSKFKPKKPKFDPKALKPFDRVLVRDYNTEKWNIGHFSYIEYDLTYIDLDLDLDMCEKTYKSVVYTADGHTNLHAVPYNDDTKHLVGTNKEAPEYYRYWED